MPLTSSPKACLENSRAFVPSRTVIAGVIVWKPSGIALTFPAIFLSLLSPPAVCFQKVTIYPPTGHVLPALCRGSFDGDCFSHFGLHALGSMQDKIGSHANHALAMSEFIHGPLHFGMVLNKPLNLFQGSPRLFQHRLHFVFGSHFRFAERHLDAAVGIHIAFAGSLNGKEDHVLVLRNHRRLSAI